MRTGSSSWPRALQTGKWELEAVPPKLTGHWKDLKEEMLMEDNGDGRGSAKVK